ncbi:MAG: glycosyltransferase family 4 protein [Bacteroidetes bacterium]|nr:glycosyltransferase family 4 protein [Bacteroidota bacterium]
MILYFGNVKKVEGVLVGEAITYKVQEIYNAQLHHYIGFSKPHQLYSSLMMFVKHHRKTSLVHIAAYSTLSFYYTLYITILSKLFRKKYIVVVHGGSYPSRLKRSKLICKFIFKGATKIITPSNFLKHHFALHGFEAICIPNFIPIEKFEFKPRKILQPNILWVRTFYKIYNTKMAARAIHRLIAKYPQIQLLMVGREEDNELNEFKALVKQLGIEKNVTIAGPLKREEWVALSVNYDIFISTTTIDNTPMSIIESLALGLPVISTNVGGVPYILTHNENALLVNSDDDHAMSEAIDLLLNSPALVEKLTRNGRALAESFSWEVVKHDWLKLLEEARNA